MGKYPVVSISLKDVGGRTFNLAGYRLTEVIAEAAGKYSFLSDSPVLSENDRKLYQLLNDVRDGKYFMDEKTLSSSLKLLSRLLSRHYGRKVIIFIDEYDVPLDKAFSNGYYEEMLSLIRTPFSGAFKTNE